jgi:uncharacterized surface protein with fasciclin (FAS1) repeats
MWAMPVGVRITHGVHVEATGVLQDLPDRLRKGDADWLRAQLELGNLDELQPHVGLETWPQLTEAIQSGDIDRVRDLLRDVNVPGVGPLVPQSRTWLWVVLAVVGAAVVALVVWLLVRGDDEADSESADELETIAATLAADPQYSTLSGLLEVAGLDTDLDGDGPFTVFAPNDDAFAALAPDELSALQDAPDILEQVLSYHIVDGRYPLDDLPDGELTTQQGEAVTVASDGEDATVNGAAIIDPDVAASNGVIQGLDTVLVPPGVSLAAEDVPTENLLQLLASNPEYSTLSGLIVRSGFATVLDQTGPYTVFAPNNAAFAALPADQLANLESDTALLRKVLAYHALFGRYPVAALEPGELTTVEGQPVAITVDGATVRVNTATINAPDLEATSGIAQGIDQVLVPPDVDLTPAPAATTTTAPPTPPATTTTAGQATTTTTEPATTTTAPPATENLYDTLAADPHFDLFVRLIDAAGLEDELADAPELTVFAPTDGAFGAERDEAEERVERIIDGLDEDELRDLLMYQAVRGIHPTDDLVPGPLATLLEDESVTIVGSGAEAQVEGDANLQPATIVAPDIEASNGVIQGINEFLLPSGIAVPD